MATTEANPFYDEEKEKSAADTSTPAQPSSSAPSNTATASSSSSPSAAQSSVPALPTFSPQLQTALQEVLPSNDPLDSPSFDPIAYINASFPDESSLAGNKLDVFLSGLRKQVKQYNDIITRDVREHSCTRSVTRDAIDHATSSITQLFNKIKQIKDKAAESEAMVIEICKDIKSLDHAKKHLTATIIALRNLHMLVSAVGQLDYMVAEKQYRDAARLIRAIDDLFSLFVAYKHIDKIQQLDSAVNRTKELCKEQLLHEFHRLLPTLQPVAKQSRHAGLDDEPPPSVDEDEQKATRQQLAEACMLTEVLDATFKRSIFLWFSSLLLEDYVALYSPGKEGATIEQIDRRYAWCKRMIRNYDDTYLAVFPVDWEMPAYVATEFCKQTKAHISKILQGMKATDVGGMVKALTKTIEFERELTYNMKMRRAPEDRGVSLHTRDNSEFDDMDRADLVENIKMKYAKNKSTEPSEGRLGSPKALDKHDNLFGKDGGGEAGGAGGKGRRVLAPIDFHGAVSDAFTPYMSSYVELERKRTDDLITKIEKEEKWSHPEESKARDRYGGSDDLFLYIKNSTNQCTRLNRNEILFNLYQEYKRGLQLYCDMLERHLSKREQLSEKELVMTAYLVNTAEYCIDTIPQLEQSIKATIDQAYKERIDLSGTVEAYSGMITRAVQALVSSTGATLRKTLGAMSKNNWESWQSVGDESEYVVDLIRTLKRELPVIARHLSPRYLNFYCTQLASVFIPRYVEAIYATKRIGELGAQQLSLDAHSLKAVMLQLPTLGNDVEDDNGDGSRSQRKKTVAQKGYTKFVTAEMSKAEALLKTLVSPSARLIVTFKALLPKSSSDDLYRVFTLKGLKKQEIQQLVDQYNATVGPDDQVRLGGSGGSSLSGGSTPAGLPMGLAGLPGVKGVNLKGFLSGLGQ